MYYLSSNGDKRTRLIVKGSITVTGAYLSKSFIVWACEKGLREFWDNGAADVLTELFGAPVGHAAGVVRNPRIVSRTASPAATDPATPDTVGGDEMETIETAPELGHPLQETARRTSHHSLQGVVIEDSFTWGHPAVLVVLAVSLLLNFVLWRQLRYAAAPMGECAAIEGTGPHLAAELDAVRDTLSTLIQSLHNANDGPT